MTDKWTMGSSYEGLYNGVNPSQDGGRKKEREKHQETTTVAPGKTQPKRKHLI